MGDKKMWLMGRAGITGGGLDGLMILGALERIEKKLDALRATLASKKRRRSGTSDPCGSTGARL